MKKILTLLLVIALSLTVLVGCDKIPGLEDIKIPGLDLGGIFGDKTPDEPTPDEPVVEADADLKAAYDYVHEMTKTIAEVTGANYDVTAASRDR